MKRSTVWTIVIAILLIAGALLLRASGGGLLDRLAALHGRPAGH